MRPSGGRPSFETPAERAPQDEAVQYIARVVEPLALLRLKMPNSHQALSVFLSCSSLSLSLSLSAYSVRVSHHPDEGWMERRQPHSQLRSRLRRATPHPGATGITLGAPPWRFRMRTHEAGSRQWNRSRQRLPAPSHQAWRSGSGPPCGAVRAASAGRHSWLRLAGSFLENAPSEPG
jgi:hypothetical protein